MVIQDWLFANIIDIYTNVYTCICIYVYMYIHVRVCVYKFCSLLLFLTLEMNVRKSVTAVPD